MTALPHSQPATVTLRAVLDRLFWMAFGFIFFVFLFNRMAEYDLFFCPRCGI